jgi:catechol 2,3-dioxygenase
MDHGTELGHVHLKVRDVDGAVEFYCDVLGLDVTERSGNFAFLSFGSEAHRASDSASSAEQSSADHSSGQGPREDGETASDEHHHDVALQEIGPDAPGPGRGVGMYHAAFEVPDAEALRATYRRLRERGVRVSPVDHGISKALYFDDPDGNGLEVYLDTREANDQWRWQGENAPFDPESLTE